MALAVGYLGWRECLSSHGWWGVVLGCESGVEGPDNLEQAGYRRLQPTHTNSHHAVAAAAVSCALCVCVCAPEPLSPSTTVSCMYTYSAGIHRVYVVDPDQRPAGVVTTTDVLQLLSYACSKE